MTVDTIKGNTRGKNVNKIYNEDCIAVMRQMENDSVDLVVTDPPYLMDYSSNKRQKNKFEGGGAILNDKNAEGLIIDYFEQCARIMKNNTHIYSFCSWHQIDFFKQEFEKHFKLKNIIIWHKPGGGIGDLKGSYMTDNEFVLFGHKGRRELRGKRIGTVQTWNKVTPSTMVHPTEKPVALLQNFIEKSSEEGEIVFDGFIGSGATGVAAINCGRKIVGCELDKRFHVIAEERVKSAESQDISQFFT